MPGLILAHQGEIQGFHELWARWNADPVVLAGLIGAGWAYHRGRPARRPGRRPWREPCFWAGMVAVAIALLSPLEVLAGELASAHMAQHVVLLLVAAPLLALGAPLTTMLAGTPSAARGRVNRLRRRVHSAAPWLAIGAPAVAWALHTGALWFWHASGPYDAALQHQLVHAAEHVSFLLTGVLFWSAVVRIRPQRGISYGYGALAVFTMGMQSVFLAVLLTFATTPWYEGYRNTTAAWGLGALADQHLAGAIMWVPGGFVYVAAGVLLVARWIRENGGHAFGDVASDWGPGDAPAHRGRQPRRSAAGHDEQHRTPDRDGDHQVALDAQPLPAPLRDESDWKSGSKRWGTAHGTDSAAPSTTPRR